MPASAPLAPAARAGASRDARATSYLKALVATLLWGLSFVALRIALEAAQPAGVVWIRNALAALALAALLRWRGLPLLPEPGDRARCVLLGAILGAHLFLQSVALRMTTAMRAGWIVAFIPVVVAAGAWLFLRQRLRPVGWFGLCVASAGVVVLTSIRPAQLARAGTGDLLMLASTLTWSAYALLAQRPGRSSGGLRVAAAALAISVAPNLALALVDGTWHAPPDARSVAALAFLGLGASALAMWTFTDAITELGPSRSSAFQYLQPFVTLLAAHFALREPTSPGQWLGGPLVLAGVWLVQRGKDAA
jgi:drug/metabolite transporter (DMT)-like permease